MEEDRRVGHHARLGAAGQLIPASLARLADAHGVTTGYEGTDQRWRPAPEATVRAALRVMGVRCDSDEEVALALRSAEQAPWDRAVPECTVLRASRRLEVPIRVPEGAHVEVAVRTEQGGVLAPTGPALPTGRNGRSADGRARVEALVPLPDDIPLGYHHVEVAGADGALARGAAAGHLIVVPDHCPDPAALGAAWGWMLQLYALRSERSWGIGDLGDLRDLLSWSAGLGADFAVVNPLHAAAPTAPQEPSPYYPSSRRFLNPLYLAVEALPDVAALDGDARRRAASLAARARAANASERIDRDAAQAAKDEVLALAFAALGPARRDELGAYRRRRGEALEDYATFCAIAEEHPPPFQQWPERLRHPALPAVAALRRERAERIAYHCWLQMLCEEQLDEAQRSARDAGMRLGVIGDLAVGVDKGGADAWALQDELGLGVSVGAPPDAFNKRGQDWQQPPLLPGALRRSGYAPVREMLGAVLRHGGGIRIDHIIGLFRLFWIPDGAPPSDGVYVRYPSDDLLGVIALEAQRAGAVVVGEDLGTVEQGVREELGRHRILTSCVLYFERDDDGQGVRPAEAYPRRALASVTTHDLPTAAGWWADEDLRLRAALGLLGDGGDEDGGGEGGDEDAEQAAKAQERERLEQALVAAGLLAPDATVADRLVAMHAFLGRTPSALVAVNLGDAVGDLRQPNLPGTRDEYPNWRLPLAEPTAEGHRPVPLERLRAHPLAQRVVDALHTAGRGR